MKSSSKPVANQSELWFLPLGGCGEIGMNMNLYSHAGQWLMVDCGVSFQDPRIQRQNLTQAKRGVFCADPSFISANRNLLQGIIITHAHEDHVGAVHWLWPRFRVPIYTSPFTAEVLHRKLRETNFAEQVDIRIVDIARPIDIGAFNVEFVSLTHSIPETHALMLRCPAGNIFHTADWKLDAKPLVGADFNEQQLRKLGKSKITAMVCDSTNANVEGWSQSEGDLYKGLKEIISAAKGRVVVACFGSNIARLQTLARIAEQCNRQFGALGRSLNNMINVARSVGYWSDALKVIHASHLGYLPANEVLAVATGSQAEERTALYRLARDDHFDLDLAKDDTVIFSSRVIPGNEAAVEKLISQLKAKGVHVFTADSNEKPIHASGHPHKDELKAMYRWIKPQIAVPVHGEPQHLEANAEVAKQSDTEIQLIGRNGDLFELAPRRRIHKNYCRHGVLCLSER